MSAQARQILRAVQVAPSILSADFGRLREQVIEVVQAGARVIHVDVMDGHFVPPITLGPLVVGALAESVSAAGAIIDVHLMIERPERQVGEFLRAGADSITFHAEATPHAARVAGLIREGGACVGLAVNPGTDARAYTEMAQEIDMALCMTVSPGWGGQPFMPGSLAKIGRVREHAGPDAALQVDGGIDEHTGPECLAAGANVFVAGSAIFNAPDPAQAFTAIAASLQSPAAGS
jgi:ribulose-phosphate 3-epimerase